MKVEKTVLGKTKEVQKESSKKKEILKVNRPKKATKSNLIGKRESFEKDTPKVLTKKQRRNKHCKQNFEWLLEGSEEIKKKKPHASGGPKETKQVSATKFVLKRDTKGLGISFFNSKRNKQARVANKTPSAKEEKEKDSRRISLKKTTGGKVSLQLEGQKKVNKEKDLKQLPKIVWNSRGQCDEATKLKSKINKVKTYWNRTSLLIPNVFRHVCLLKEDSGMLFEYLDLSKKELLVQANGQKAISQAGAPHLQRKNKGGARKEGKGRLGKGAEKKVNKCEIGKKEENVVQQILIEEPEKEEKEAKKDVLVEKRKKSISRKSTKSSPNKKETFFCPKEKQKKSIKEIQGNEISEKEKKLEKIKKQLREDLNKAHEKIEKSYISKEAENWSRKDLEAFNNNISEYNQLLDEQEKLKVYQMETSKSTERESSKFATMRLLEEKFSKKNCDKIKQKVSMFMQRKGLVKETKEGPRTAKLTLQDILKMEFDSSRTKDAVQLPLQKTSKRIQKKRNRNKKKSSSFADQTNRKRALAKKNSLPFTNPRAGSSLFGNSHEVDILEGVRDEDLVVSVNQDSLEDLSDSSLRSLDDIRVNRNVTHFEEMIIRN